jgi:SAM-dependent methyltransferase
MTFPFQTRWEGTTYRYLRCSQCRSAFVDPMPDEPTRRAMYAWDRYHAHHYTDADPTRHDTGMALLRRYVPAGGSVLDFGCGSGDFLIRARREGYAASGVEFSSSTVAAAGRRSGCRVMSLDDAEDRGMRFDAIHTNDVLPHVPDPLEVCRRLEARLAPDGIFIVSGPLEHNASLVFWTASGFKGLRRALGLDRDIPAGAPTMLVRLNARAQRAFFVDRLGYEEEWVRVFETGWPYRAAGASAQAPGRQRVRYAIGSAAVLLARARPLRSLRLGNRFAGVYRPVRR